MTHPSRPDSTALSLLNVFEVADPQGGPPHHLVALVEPVRAGSVGIPARCVLGEFTPGPDGGFDPATFQPNPEFVAALVGFMNREADRSPSLSDQARVIRTGWLYVEDPRASDDSEGAEPRAGDLLGAFAVDEGGQIVPGSFQYNSGHALLDPERGPSGLLNDRRFHDWIHAV